MKCLICSAALIKPHVGRNPTYCSPCGYKRNLNSVRISSKKRRDELKDKVYTKLGYKCNICSESDPIVLQVDHINNDGALDRKKFKNISEFYSHILTNSPQVQLLCCNCNWRKEYYRRNGVKKNANS